MNPQFAQPKGSTSKETNKDSIARKFGCKKSEVVYAKSGQSLSGYKVIYDKVSQRAYALPSNIGTVTVTSLVDGILTHSGGTVDLGALAVLREEYVTLVENFTSGFTIRVKNEVVSDGVNLYCWDGSLPKTVNAGDTPGSTGGIGLGAWVSVGVASLRTNLNEIDGESYIGGATYAQIRSYAGSATRIKCIGRNNALDNCYGIFELDVSDTTTPDDDGCVLVGVGGKRWKRQFSGSRNVVWFGAVQGDDSQAVADINREAFRNACLSYKDSWAAQVASGKNISVECPAGDFNLSNGFTVPEGVTLIGAGIGATRLKIESATASVSGFKLALIVMGKVIDRTTTATENTDGVFLPGLAPTIDNLYLNPKNSNTAVEIATDTAGKDLFGWRIGTLWIQAAIGILMRNTGDGIIDQLMIEAATATGIKTEGNVQNVICNAFYGFDIGFPLYISGATNNFNIGIMQNNYTRSACIAVEASSLVRGLKIGDFVCNQNVQHASFTDVIGVYGTSTADITIGNMSVRNANGYVINNNSISSTFNIGTLELNQLPLNPVYIVGTALKGIISNGGVFNIAQVTTSGLTTPLFTATGSNATVANFNSGTIGGQTSAVIFASTNTSTETVINSKLTNLSGKPFASPSDADKISYDSWMPVASNATYKYATMPYKAGSSAWEVTVKANPLPSGSSSYMVTEKFIAHIDTAHDGSSIVNMKSVTTVSRGANQTIPGHIEPAFDISASTGDGQSFFQVPTSYGNVKIKVKTLHV